MARSGLYIDPKSLSRFKMTLNRIVKDLESESFELLEAWGEDTAKYAVAHREYENRTRNLSNSWGVFSGSRKRSGSRLSVRAGSGLSYARPLELGLGNLKRKRPTWRNAVRNAQKKRTWMLNELKSIIGRHVKVA